MKMLLKDTGEKFIYKGADLHTRYGVIKSKAIEEAKPGTILCTNTGKEFVLTESRFMDHYKKIKRGAQIIPLKDIGPIVAETGINKDCTVLDAGAGSGALCCFLANLVKKVYTYEKRPDFAGIVEKNIKNLGLKNITLKIQDIYEGIDEKNLDLITLDLPEPWKAIPHSAAALKHGAYMMSYSPTIPQVSDFVEAVKLNDSFLFVKTIEIMEREWDVAGRKLRPRSQAIGHSGFMSFCRKL